MVEYEPRDPVTAGWNPLLDIIIQLVYEKCYINMIIQGKHTNNKDFLRISSTSLQICTFS